jgi:hypothetical protein
MNIYTLKTRYLFLEKNVLRMINEYKIYIEIINIFISVIMARNGTGQGFI